VFLAINWAVDSEIIDGYRTPNLYGLLFVTGLVLGYFVVKRMFKQEGIKEDVLDKLVAYMVIATIVGARLGHVLFYGPYFDSIDNCGTLQPGYFEHPITIFYIWEGGLASHGGAIAILISLYLFSIKIAKKPFIWILDRISVPIAIAGTFIRLGNLVNHEIVGDPTNLPWAFSFKHFFNEATCSYDPTPRHPAQLYEAICYFIAFLILLFLYWKKEKWKQPGFVFGCFLISIFGARFMVEFIKLGQTARDDVWFLNTGQLLSIPLVIWGIALIFRALKLSKNEASN
jgi:prolipoprotein diacylglyceryl transferase